LLLPLLSGASVVIAPDLRTLSAQEFWALLAAKRVTHINSVPSFFESVLHAAARQPDLRLKRLMLGGEPLSGTLCRQLRAALPHTELFNMYGPTEACIDATVYRIPDEVDESLSSLPIGRPLANYSAYVLDAHGQPLPPGIAGELYLGLREAMWVNPI
jgi:non-ribosomal peptide synthetase component F